MYAPDGPCEVYGVYNVLSRQEAVNYLGYYSSHEQLMQQLILEQADNAVQRICAMVSQGMVHCRRHLLWNKLQSLPSRDWERRRDKDREELSRDQVGSACLSLKHISHLVLLIQSHVCCSNKDRWFYPCLIIIIVMFLKG
jgi:hypothetical protein